MNRIASVLAILVLAGVGAVEAQSPTVWWPSVGTVVLSGGSLDDRMANERGRIRRPWASTLTKRRC